ncbi:hypothetical protein ACQJBY_017289 [Aegilops geniculata]
MEEDVVMPTTTSSNVFDEMSQCLDDEVFIRATSVSNDDYFSQKYASQEYDTQYGDDNLDMDEEGFVMKGRIANYTNAEDVLICIAWKKSLLMHPLEVTKPRTRIGNASRSTSMSATLAATFNQGNLFINVGAPSMQNVKSGPVAWQMLVA